MVWASIPRVAVESLANIVSQGTYCNRNATGQPTIMGTLVDLLSEPGRDIRYFRGLGTKTGFVEKYIGGMSYN
jgi:hypothetical protein